MKYKLIIFVIVMTVPLVYMFVYLNYCYLTPMMVSHSTEEYWRWYDEFQTTGDNGICDDDENILNSPDCRFDLIGDYYRENICRR